MGEAVYNGVLNKRLGFLAIEIHCCVNNSTVSGEFLCTVHVAMQ